MSVSKVIWSIMMIGPVDYMEARNTVYRIMMMVMFLLMMMLIMVEVMVMVMVITCRPELDWVLGGGRETPLHSRHHHNVFHQNQTEACQKLSQSGQVQSDDNGDDDMTWGNKWRTGTYFVLAWCCPLTLCFNKQDEIIYLVLVIQSAKCVHSLLLLLDQTMQ